MKSKLETDLLRIIINSYPKRSPDGQVKAILKLIDEDRKENKGVEPSKSTTKKGVL